MTIKNRWIRLLALLLCCLVLTGCTGQPAKEGAGTIIPTASAVG